MSFKIQKEKLIYVAFAVAVAALGGTAYSKRVHNDKVMPLGKQFCEGPGGKVFDKHGQVSFVSPQGQVLIKVNPHRYSSILPEQYANATAFCGAGVESFKNSAPRP